MPDKRKHRGPNPKDANLFSSRFIVQLKAATNDLSWLLGRGYSERSALKIVGDRYRLTQRQRMAVSRVCTAPQNSVVRIQKEVRPIQLRRQVVEIDGFNLLIIIESALAGAYVFECMDGCFRDIASLHSTYKRVLETPTAIHLVGEALTELQVRNARWLLDQPISNSGRLKHLLLEIAEQEQWPWEVDLVYNPDRVLSESDEIVASSDGIILDKADKWFNLCRFVVETRIESAQILRIF